MNRKFFAIAITAAMFTLAFSEIADAGVMNGIRLNGLVRNGNKINAFTVKRGTVNGTQLQSIKVEGGQLVALRRPPGN